MASGDTPQVICVLSLVARNSSSATRRPSILMVGEDIHDAPGHAGQDRHADHRYPPQIPAAQRDRDEEEDEEEEAISGGLHAAAQDEQVGQTYHNILQLKAFAHVICRYLMQSDLDKITT